MRDKRVQLVEAGGLVDALAPVIHLDGGALGLACSLASKELSFLSLQPGGTSHGVNISIEWGRDMGSRSWEVSVLDGGMEDVPAIYTAREDGNLHAYAIDGTPRWSHGFNAAISPFELFYDVQASTWAGLFPSLDKTLRLLDLAAGRLAWGDTFNSGVNCVARSSDGHYISAGGNDNTLRLYSRPESGGLGSYSMEWFHKFDGYVREVAFSKNNLVAAVADDGFVKVLDVATGTVRWAAEKNSFGWKCLVLDGPGIVVSTSYQVPIDVDESGEKLGNPGVVSSHFLEDGTMQWETAPEDKVNANVILNVAAGGTECIVAGTTWGEIVFLDVGSGAVVAKIDVGAQINGLHVASMDGHQVLVGCRETEEKSVFLLRLDEI